VYGTADAAEGGGGEEVGELVRKRQAKRPLPNSLCRFAWNSTLAVGVNVGPERHLVLQKQSLEIIVSSFQL
jgi:hypothetical protein